MKRSIVILSLFTATFSSAQLFDDLDAILAATTSDAQKLADAYVAPMGQSLTYSLNSGWANSAKTHKKFGFDITIGVASPSVSDEAKSFNINALKLDELRSDATTASTVLGADRNTTFYYELQLPDNTTVRQNVALPGGLGDDLVMNSLPTPYLQVGLGLLFDTDIIVRYVPKTKIKGLEFDVLGVGVKHNLMQYFGLLDKLPLNVSALASFTKLNGNYQLNNAKPDQKVDLGVDTFMVQALASLDFPIISVVGGFGYGKGDASIQLLGDYSTEYPGTSKDPLKVEDTYTGTHAMVGVRANLLFLKIFANYTLQKFNTLNAGISFSFR